MIVGVKSWNQIGDNLFLTGAVRNVRAVHPEYKFVFVGSEYYRPLFENNPDFTGEIPRIVLPTLCYGEGEPEARNGTHVQAQTRMLCNLLGIEQVPFSVNTPVVYLTEDEKLSGLALSGWWLVNANHQTCSISKNYPHWVEVAEGMHEMGLKFAQVGGKEKRDITVDLPHAFDVRGRTSLRQWLAMIYWCKGIVTPPSGIMNAGAIWGKPMVVLAGARENVKVTDYPTARYVTTDCQYRYCESQTKDQCRIYDNGCPCMDFPAERVLREVRNLVRK